jgi:hypothetical protein
MSGTPASAPGSSKGPDRQHPLRHQQDTLLGELPARPKGHRDVGILLPARRQPLGRDDLQVQFRMRLAEGVHAGNEPQARKSVIGAEPDDRPVARGSDDPLQFVQLGDRARGDVEHAPTFIRQGHAAMQPPEQRHAETLLQLAHLVADRGLAQSPCPGGSGQRATPADLDQQAHPARRP